MQPIIPILFAAVVGMGHAFEPDHLLAVSTLVTRHDLARLTDNLPPGPLSAGEGEPDA